MFCVNKFIRSIVRLFLVIVFITQVVEPLYAADFFEGKITRVVDANLFIMQGGTRVKCAGIEVPGTRDSSRVYMAVAQNALSTSKKLLLGKTVRFRFEETASGSTESLRSAYIFVGGQMLNGLLLKKGYAMVSPSSPPSDEYSQYFLKMQQEAKNFQRGLWK